MTNQSLYDAFERMWKHTKELGGGVSPDWNQNDESARDYVKNRTHYVASGGVKTVTFDGDVTGKLHYEYKNESGITNGYLVKLTDDTPEESDFLNMECSINIAGNVQPDIFTQEMIDSMFIPIEESGLFTGGSGYMIGDSGVVVTEDTELKYVITGETFVLTKGIWVFYIFEDQDVGMPSVYIASLSYGSPEVVVQLDEKFIPDSIMRVSDNTHYTEEEGFRINCYDSGEGFSTSGFAEGFSLRQVSDKTLTLEELKQCNVGLVQSRTVIESSLKTAFDNPDPMLVITDDYIMAIPLFVITYKDDVTLPIAELLGVQYDHNVSNKGIHFFVQMDGNYNVINGTVYLEKPWKGKKLDFAYMPEDAVGKRGIGKNAEVFNANISDPEDANIAFGENSHAEGWKTRAFGKESHAEGCFTHAWADYSHTEGVGTAANCEAQHVQGRYNEVDDEHRYAHIIGNGTNVNGGPSNCHTVEWKGNAWYRGDVYVGGTNQDEGKKLATEEYVDSKAGGSGGGLTEEQVENIIENYMAENPVQGGGATPDWNQNDENAGDYIKNRPFFAVETNDTIVYFLPETEVSFVNVNPTDENRYYGEPTLEEAGRLILGKRYTVVFDGVVYPNLECFDDEGYPTLGSSYDDLSEESEYPFSMYSTDELPDKLGIDIIATGEETHTVTITTLGMHVKQIAEQFIPDTIARTKDVEAMFEELAEGIDSMFGEYITDIANLVGGDA